MARTVELYRLTQTALNLRPRYNPNDNHRCFEIGGDRP
jgi:hypothetical protein